MYVIKLNPKRIIIRGDTDISLTVIRKEIEVMNTSVRSIAKNIIAELKFSISTLNR